MKSHVPLETGNPGRPLTDSTPASGHIHLRVTMERKNRYVRAARTRKMKLSEWMTETCDNGSGLVTANRTSDSRQSKLRKPTAMPAAAMITTMSSNFPKPKKLNESRMVNPSCLS